MIMVCAHISCLQLCHFLSAGMCDLRVCFDVCLFWNGSEYCWLYLFHFVPVKGMPVYDWLVFIWCWVQNGLSLPWSGVWVSLGLTTSYWAEPNQYVVPLNDKQTLLPSIRHSCVGWVSKIILTCHCAQNCPPSNAEWRAVALTSAAVVNASTPQVVFVLAREEVWASASASCVSIL